jgi:hypothetical protein
MYTHWLVYLALSGMSPAEFATEGRGAAAGQQTPAQPATMESAGRNAGPAPKPQAPSITSIQSTGVKHVRRNVE